jgi:hypothetical protein
MLGNWLTPGRLERRTVRGGWRGPAVLSAQFDPEPLTGGLESHWQVDADSPVNVVTLGGSRLAGCSRWDYQRVHAFMGQSENADFPAEC